MVLLFSCLSETEQEKINNAIMDQMYYKTKLMSPRTEGFNAERYYVSSINDSIVFCQQNYSYENIFGAKEHGKTYGYFNARNGNDVTDYVEFLTSDLEMSRIRNLLK